MAVSEIFVINPGSTSTKIALFEGEKMIFSKNVEHSAEELMAFKEIVDQLEYREAIILEEVKKAGYTLEGCDAFVGRGGSTRTLTGGTYEANDILLEHLRIGIAGYHPASLGVLLANRFASRCGGRVFMVNGPLTDEFQDVARVTGFRDIYRESITHALNQKEVGIRYARSKGKRYQDVNLVISHLGGGVSVTAHRKGRMVDSTDVLHGDGPMAPTRAGTLPAVALSKLCYSGQYTQREIYNRITKSGGLVDHLGTSDAREISSRIQAGDLHAKLIYDAMIYQVAKSIGSYATVLKGQVDAILLTGGIARDEYVVEGIREMTAHIAPIEVYAGEFEMEALATGALRVLNGEESPLSYTGDPVWEGFSFVQNKHGN